MKRLLGWLGRRLAPDLSTRGEEAGVPEDDTMAIADAVAEPVGLARRDALAAIAAGLAAAPAETNRRLAEIVRADRNLMRMSRLPRRLERFYRIEVDR